MAEPGDSSVSELGHTRTDPAAARSAQPRVADLVGAVLDGRYEIVRAIGGGGMGIVYEARHRELGRRLAVKVIRSELAGDTDHATRLRREARLASSIGDAHIVDVIDVGTTSDGRPYVVMEHLDGPSLKERLAERGQLPEGEAIGLTRQVAIALAAAHKQGIVRRDVKPANVVLVRRDGRDFAKVVDFGVSKVQASRTQQVSLRVGQEIDLVYPR